MSIERNLFDRFGGIRPMAEALGESPSTVQSWKTAGRVPATKQPDVLTRGAELKLSIEPIDVVFPLICRPDLPAKVSSFVHDASLQHETSSVACNPDTALHRGAA